MPVPRDNNDVIGRIYEAAAFPERWPGVLHAIGGMFGARGGNLIRSSATGLVMFSSPDLAEITREFDRQGWNAQNSRVERLLARCGHPGFLADSHIHTDEEIATLPMYTEFLAPRGAAAGAATVVQGAANDGLMVAIEMFPSHEASRRAVLELDLLRPHIARSAVMGGLIQESRAATLIEAFDTVGLAIALLQSDGKVVAVSHAFAEEASELVSDTPSRLRMVDEESDRRFAAALHNLAHGGAGASVALRDRDKIGSAVLHVIGARRDARDLFSRVTVFAVLSRPGNTQLPAADIVATLFDLTPAEARIARGIAEGLTPAELAERLGVSSETVRVQLKRVFSKTSTRRQSELALLLAGLK